MNRSYKDSSSAAGVISERGATAVDHIVSEVLGFSLTLDESILIRQLIEKIVMNAIREETGK